MQNEGLRQRPAWRWRWPGGPGGVQPGRGGMEGQVAAPHPKGLEAANLEGLETAEVLEAMAGLEVEANLEVLESVGLEAAVGTNLEGLEAVVGTNLEVPAVASTWRRSAWRAWRRSAWRAGGGGSSSKEMRRRCGGPGGWPGGGPGGDGPGGGGRLGDPAVEVRRRLVIRPTSSSSMEGLKESLGMKITAQGLTTTHLSGKASSWCRRSNLHLFEETKQLDD
ncbi:uncharacterized protein LOC132452348 isoform X2 [Gadus macrocephalus]|uniref:uncharacterized protein LOC132452348 isoform X2 n=1 Tax=Gadus macrocephalus TaxID=80720 RepID=UPI0028CB2110|nr:uncharacterized protein LOC132452348 isoform X2 [Gadus macrocephalus]